MPPIRRPPLFLRQGSGFAQRKQCGGFDTPSGYRQKPNCQELVDFVLAAWEKVTPHCIKAGFLQAGISNAMDGSEDDKVKF